MAFPPEIYIMMLIGSR